MERLAAAGREHQGQKQRHISHDRVLITLWRVGEPRVKSLPMTRISPWIWYGALLVAGAALRIIGPRISGASAGLPALGIPLGRNSSPRR